MKRPVGNIVEGPMGLHMPESVARRIDELSKGLPKDFTYRRVAKSAGVKRLDPGERTDVSIINTASIDRDGDCILPSGCDDSSYNRVVTFVHKYDELPVGSNQWVTQEDGKLLAKTHYPTKPPEWGNTPWLPSAILHFMQQAVPTCTGKSVGLLPVNVRPPTREEVSRNPALRNANQVIDKWKLIEYAVAPVPVNSDAEMQVVAKCERDGIVTPEFASLIRKSMETLAYTRKRPTPNLSMSKYAHIDFKANKETAKAHKEGLERHAAGESKGQATPEMLAMARHMAEGGEASPDYVRKAVEYHEKNAHHLAAKPGTSAYCCAMIMGGHAGREHYKCIMKSMDDADASPDSAVDQNSVQAAITKAEGAAEGDMASGGAVAAQETAVIDPLADAMKNKAVSQTQEPQKKDPEVSAAAEPSPVDPAPAPVKKAVTQDQINKAVEREIDSRQDAILAKALLKAQDLAILAMGGV